MPSDLIGIRTPWFSEEHYKEGGPFKRELFVWDKLGLTNLETWIPLVEELSVNEDYVGARDFLWLLEQGFLFDIPLPNRKQTDNQEFNPYFNVLDEVVVKNVDASQTPEWNDALSRIATIVHNLESGERGVPLLETPAFQLVLPGSRKDSVLEIVLDGIPIPSISTSYEQILEYRSDEDSKRKYLGLRSWIAEIAKAEMSVAEIKDKFEYQISEYEKHIKLHKMKYNLTSTKVLVSAIPELLERLIKLQFGKVAHSYFELRKSKVDLMLAEQSAPGKELAYIYDVKEKFG